LLKAANTQDEDYLAAAKEFGPAIERMAGAYERNPEHRRDLVQDIHVQLWRSMRAFDGRCSLRTWVYRVGHNVGASHVGRQKRLSRGLCGLEELDELAASDNPEAETGERRAMDRLLGLIRALKAVDRQVMLLFLEDLGPSEIAEVTGLSANAVAVKIHRIRLLLKHKFNQGGAV
jgi:RNA polymerase sigma-70 factor (ECF subfamily)